MSVRLWLTCAGALAAAQPAAPWPPEPLGGFLTSELRLSKSEVTALARGDVVARVLERREGREVAALGVVSVAATPVQFVDAVLRVETMRQALGAVAVGRFSDPPRLDDVAALSLDDGDLEAVRTCRVGDCDVKLPAAAIEQFRTGVDWSAVGARARANAVFRQVLVDLVSAYIRTGNDALADYADRPGAPSLPGDIRGLVAGSPFFAHHAPSLIAALESAPSATPRGMTSVIFWSKEAPAGYKPVVSVTHLVVDRAADGQAAFTASKQLYASHYFDASVALTAVMSSPPPSPPGIHVLYLNRSRVDALRGGWTGVKRAIAGRRIRRALDAGLQALKRQLEKGADTPTKTDDDTTPQPIAGGSRWPSPPADAAGDATDAMLDPPLSGPPRRDGRGAPARLTTGRPRRC